MSHAYIHPSSSSPNGTASWPSLMLPFSLLSRDTEDTTLQLLVYLSSCSVLNAWFPRIPVLKSKQQCSTVLLRNAALGSKWWEWGPQGYKISCCFHFIAAAVINILMEAAQRTDLLAYSSRPSYYCGQDKAGTQATHLQSRAERQEEPSHAAHLFVFNWSRITLLPLPLSPSSCPSCTSLNPTPSLHSQVNSQ